MEGSATQHDHSKYPECPFHYSKAQEGKRPLELGAAGVKLNVDIKGTIQARVRSGKLASPVGTHVQCLPD